MKIIIFFLTLASLAFAAPKSRNLHLRGKPKQFSSVPKIVGGNIADPHSIPYQALLEFYTETHGWYCGGSLISQNYVITSATCANATVEVLVTLGAHNVFITESTQINIFSTDIVIHEAYGQDYSYLNDIAVIKLPRTINYTSAIQPVALPKRADIDTVYLGVAGRIAGWGSGDSFDQKIFDLLRYFDTRVISSLDEKCRNYELPGSMFCTSGEFDDTYVGPCNGDDGTGFVVDDVLVGIVVFNIYCLEGYPGFHTRVVNYLDWIVVNTDVVAE